MPSRQIVWSMITVRKAPEDQGHWRQRQGDTFAAALPGFTAALGGLASSPTALPTVTFEGAKAATGPSAGGTAPGFLGAGLGAGLGATAGALLGADFGACVL